MTQQEEAILSAAKAFSIASSLAAPKKRSLTVAGHRTSITLEDAFWIALKGVAAECGCTVSALVSAIDSKREPASLSASIRVFVLRYYQSRTSS